MHGKGVKTRYLGEIYSAHPVKFGPKVNEGLVPDRPFALPLRRRKRILQKVNLCIECVKVAFDLPVAGFYLVVIKVIELNGLLQREEMFFPVVSLKGLRNILGGTLHPGRPS
jgi:hypothetical protein